MAGKVPLARHDAQHMWYRPSYVEAGRRRQRAGGGRAHQGPAFVRARPAQPAPASDAVLVGGTPVGKWPSPRLCVPLRTRTGVAHPLFNLILFKFNLIDIDHAIDIIFLLPMAIELQ